MLKDHNKLLKEALFRIFTLFLTIGIMILVSEILLGFLYPHLKENVGDNPYFQGTDPCWNLLDPELGFIHKPFIKWEGFAYSDPGAHYIVYRTDENGFRNPLGIHSAQIVFVGDSFTEAGNMPEKDTFVQVVASRLNVTAVNLGHIFYGPQQELKVIQRYAFRYSPETIVWVIFEANDIGDAEKYKSDFLQSSQNLFSQKEQRSKFSYRTFKKSINRQIRSTLIFKCFQSLYHSLYLETISKGKIYHELHGTFPTSENKIERVDFFVPYKPNIINEMPQGWKETKDSIFRGLQLCRDRKIHLIIVFIPEKLRVMGPFTSFSSKTTLDKYIPGGKWENEHDFSSELAKYCKDIGCDFIDARKALIEKAKSGQLVYSARYSYHLDTVGHLVIADLVVEKILNYTKKLNN